VFRNVYINNNKMIYAKLAAFSALVLSVQGKRDLDTYSFEKFVQEFKPQWSATEHASRRAIFETELARVRQHNAGSASWKEGINKYSAMTLQEKKASFGRSKRVAASHKPKHEQVFDLKLKDVSELPASVDWRQHSPNVVSSVKDQGHCGSCWAFAATATLESIVAINSGLLFDFSPQQIAMCSPNPNHCGGTGGCEGATAEIAFDYVAGSVGALEEYELGYQAYYGVDSSCGVTDSMLPKATIKGFTQLPANNYTALMNSVAQVGPIAISVDASTFHAYESGIFSGCNQEQPDINHAVVLVGYGEENGQKYWIVRNSWSASYGEAGYIRVARSDADEEVCGMDTTPHDGSACDGEDDAVKVCGTCGILYDSSYPTGAALA
jgi:cathepsin L